MRSLLNLFLCSAILIMTVAACGQSGETNNTQPSSSAPSETEEMDSMSTGILNVNLATEADLQELGLSTELIDRIMEERPFLVMNDLDALLGEMDNKEELYASMFVPFNLNTTAEADFKMIPGVGDRMAHEFEEYRPYTSIKQFRREIGKYVDDAEVARLEQYVFVPIELNTATEEDIKALPGVGDRMAHEFEEYRPYSSMEQFRREIGKYVDDKELARLERFVYLDQQ